MQGSGRRWVVVAAVVATSRVRSLIWGGMIPPSSTSERGGCGSWEHLLRLSPQLANCWGVFGSEEVEFAAGADLRT